MRALRTTACLAALATLVTGCADQPIASFEQPRVTSLAAQAQTDLYFEPGGARLVPGEQEKLRRFLAEQILRPTDDVSIELPSSGIARVDRQRLGTLSAAVGSVPARVSVTGTAGFVKTGARPDAAFVQVFRYDRVAIDCVNSGRSALADQLLVPFPPMGCANTINRAEMTAEIRDLTAPEPLGQTDAVTSVAAVKRYVDGTTKPPPFGLEE